MADLTVEEARFRSMREAFLAQLGGRSATKFERKAAYFQFDPKAGLVAIPRTSTVYNGTGIEVDPTLQSRVVSMIRSVAPALADAYSKRMGDVAAEAFDAWPVDTGLSKALIFLEYDTDGQGTFSARIGCRAPYTYYIQSPDSVAMRLIFGPGKAAADRVAEDVARDVAT